MRHRKQILLFLVAVLIPGLTLVFFTQRLIRQDKELAVKRAADERGRLAGEIGRDLQLRLERLTLEVSQDEAAILDHPAAYAPLRPELVAVALVENGRIVLPWESSEPAIQAQRRALAAPAVAGSLSEGERAEFEKKDLALAASLYRRALAAAAKEGRPYLRLLLARALAKSGRAAEAREEYEALLELAPGEEDEDGMPIYLYAADRLAGVPSCAGRIAARIDSALTVKPWMSPPEAALIASILERIAHPAAPAAGAEPMAADLIDKIRAYSAKADRLLALQRDFERRPLAAIEAGPTPAWEVDAEHGWLLGTGLFNGGRRFLLVADIAALNAALLNDRTFRRTYPSEILLTTSESAGAYPLGPDLRGLYAVPDGPADGSPLAGLSPGRPFYLLTMIAVILFAGLGGYLLWRDVRRELDLAEIRSQFAASVSHELKTPLTSIRMFAETVRLGRVKDEAARDEYLDTIINESERLSRLLNNVLDVSKIEQGKKLYRPRPQALGPILRAAVRTMDYPLRQQDFSLALAIDDDLPDVRVDADALEQAVLNLIGNAIKYSGSSREIGLELGREGSWAVVRVTDRGVGIPPGERQRIFEKFYRVPSPENRQVPGTGLGLALVAHFAREHGGRIEVDSEPGRGSTFALYLPLEAEP